MPLESSVTGVNPNQYGSRKESGIDSIPVGSQGAAGSPPAAPGPASSGGQGPVDVIEPGATPVGDVAEAAIDQEDHDFLTMRMFWGNLAEFDDDFREIAEELSEQIGQYNGELQPVGLDNAIQPSAQPLPQEEATAEDRVSGEDYGNEENWEL